MSITSITAPRKNLYGIIKDVVQNNEAVTVTSKSGNVVIVPESDYNTMMETIYLMSAPGLHEKLAKARKADLSEYTEYNPNEEWQSDVQL